MVSFTLLFVAVLCIVTFGSHGLKIGMCQGPCPDGWVHHSGRCYLHIAEKKTWLDAELNCLDLGGNLVSVHSQDEHQFLKDLNLNRDPSNGAFWIGLSDIHKENVWIWSDGTKPGDFQKWNPGQPNNAHGKEDCGQSNYGAPHEWNDMECDAKYSSICNLRWNY